VEINFEYNRTPKPDKSPTVLTIIILILIFVSLVLVFVNSYLALAASSFAAGAYIGGLIARSSEGL